MRFVPIAHLKPNMVVDKAIFGANDRVLLNKGVTLTKE